jgi:hypothetical protein
VTIPSGETVVQLRAGKFTWVREIEFWCHTDGRTIRDQTRVGFVILFGHKLQHGVARAWQIAHEVWVNPKPGRHGFWSDILEFKRGQKIRSKERIPHAHRQGEGEIKIREHSRIKIALECVANFFHMPRPVAHIAVLRAPIRTG